MNANEYIIVGKVRDWHQPKNELCPHNRNLSDDCTCPRPVNRKPFRVVRVNDPTVPRNHKSKVVIEIHPNGLLVLREHGRRKSYSITAGELYNDLIWKEARAAVAAKRKARRGK